MISKHYSYTMFHMTVHTKCFRFIRCTCDFPENYPFYTYDSSSTNNISDIESGPTQPEASFVCGGKVKKKLHRLKRGLAKNKSVPI